MEVQVAVLLGTGHKMSPVQSLDFSLRETEGGCRVRELRSFFFRERGCRFTAYAFRYNVAAAPLVASGSGRSRNSAR